MRTLKILLSALLLLLVQNAMVHAQENQSYIMHTIEKGQTLTAIASMYNISIDDIVRLNPGSETTIYEGRQLRIPRRESRQEDSFHTIVSGETLYGLSQKYHITVRSIMDANPGLSATNFKAGQVIRIPASSAENTLQPAQPTEQQAIPGAVESKCREMHKVQRGETVYSISRKYGITEQELIAANPELQDVTKLKRNAFICIPYPAKKEEPKAEERIPTDSELFQANAEATEKLNTIKAALILPFHKNGNPVGETQRMVEYYQGFLLAVDSLKSTGANISIHTYNSGSEVSEINAILQKPELKEMDIIFGPLHAAQVQPLADFARKNEIRLVIPFSSRDNTVYNNPQIYQVNTPQSYFYSEVYDHFSRQFPNAHVIFIESAGNDKADFIKGFKEDLQRKSVPITTLSESADYVAMKGTLRADKENIFVPTSGSNTALIKTLPQITLMVRDSTITTTDNIHVFGYPEWQTYTDDFLSTFFELDTYFYSSFYTNNLMNSSKAFISKFRRWYGKEMEDRYPKYGMLGFDTGFYFLKGLWLYGTAFEQSQQQMKINPIQTGFKYERVNNWGGFINKKVFFVHFTREHELIKLDFD